MKINKIKLFRKMRALLTNFHPVSGKVKNQRFSLQLSNCLGNKISHFIPKNTGPVLPTGCCYLP